MPTYVTIGAVRIQSWLDRTRTLRARRGASWALREHTSASKIAAVLPDGAQADTAAGDVDGVVSLVLDAADDADADRVVARVLTHLRRHLPGLEFEVVRATGAASHDEARPMLEERRANGEVQIWLPAAGEFPLARLCAGCGLAPAVTERTVDDGRVGVCADCAVRLDRAGSAKSRKDVPGPESDLTAGLRQWAPQHAARPFADEFDDLARLAADERGLSGTHLATVFVDGNRLGAFATQARKSNMDITGDITAATGRALAEATAAIARSDDTMLPVVPHLTGGDDVLVSVVADRAWAFTRQLLHRFTALLTEPAREWGTAAAPTASAGIVFARANHPFHRSVDLAHDALRQAKYHYIGLEAAVCWLDVTAEGPELPTDRVPIPLSVLRDRWDRLTALRQVPTSARNRLLRAVVDGPGQAERQIARLGLTTAQPFLTDTALPLGTALLIARWLR